MLSLPSGKHTGNRRLVCFFVFSLLCASHQNQSQNYLGYKLTFNYHAAEVNAKDQINSKDQVNARKDGGPYPIKEA